MNHHLAALLPHCLLTSPLDVMCKKSLNSLSVNTIYLQKQTVNQQEPLSVLLEILHPFAILHPDESSSEEFTYQISTRSTVGEMPILTGKAITSGCDPDHCELIDPMQLAGVMSWLRSEQKKWIVSPLGVLPVIRALLNIHQFDPYLAEHYFRQFHPIYLRLDDADLTRLALRQTARADSVNPDTNSSAASDYLKIERKLYRQYADDESLHS